MNQGPDFSFQINSNNNQRTESITPEQNANNNTINNPNFNWQNTTNNNNYELKKENNELKKKLKDRSMAISIPAVLILVILINLGWFLGVKLIIYPKFEESLELNESMKEEYQSLKRKVNAIVGEE